LRRFLIATVLAASLAAPVTAEIRPDQVMFRELYKELVETNTTLSAGSCTLAAERMAARLKAAGYKDGDIRLFGVSDRPKEGGLVALNEGGVGLRDASGKKLSLGIQAGEKVYQDFRIEASNPGGHSSRPRPDNAIYSLAAALVRIGQYEFPVQFTDTTRAYFTETAKLSGGEAATAFTASTNASRFWAFTRSAIIFSS